MYNYEYTNKEGVKIELQAIAVKKHLIIDRKVPAVIDFRGQLWLGLHQEGYWDHERFKQQMLKLPVVPVEIRALEKYYFAAEDGELEKMLAEAERSAAETAGE